MPTAARKMPGAKVSKVAVERDFLEFYEEYGLMDQTERAGLTAGGAKVSRARDNIERARPNMPVLTAALSRGLEGNFLCRKTRSWYRGPVGRDGSAPSGDGDSSVWCTGRVHADLDFFRRRLQAGFFHSTADIPDTWLIHNIIDPWRHNTALVRL